MKRCSQRTLRACVVVVVVAATTLTMEEACAFTMPSTSLSKKVGGHVAGGGDGAPPSTTTTSLSASVAPILIIGPMIKKMREENAKKNQPAADASERASEAAGLKVGKNSWKWPPIWPYEKSFFTPTMESDARKASEPAADINQMASMLSGIAQAPTLDGLSDDKDKEDEFTFNAMEYWRKEENKIKTEMAPDAVEKLQSHFEYYLREGMDILEFGAAENSYLPDGVKPNVHVGVGACEELMKQNPSLTDTYEIDLNDVVEDRDVDSDDLRRLAQTRQFDAILMTNAVPFLRYPREVFRTAWYLLKPGGIMIVSFGGKDSVTSQQFKEAQTAMWRDYNDDQHIWITGSFFQFSAGDGWTSLLGFDISPESASSDSGNPLEKVKRLGGASNNLYVVQAVKGYQDDRVDPENLERSIQSLCWMLPTLEDRDKKLVVPRLARSYEVAESKEVRDAIERNIQRLPTIYEALIKMDQYAFTFGMQSQLAADLVTNPNFDGSEEQMLNMKQGLGLRTPSKEFWAPVGENTMNLSIEDKINLLAYIVPCFGNKGSEEETSAQQDALQAFVTGMKPTYEVVRRKCPDLPASDVELIGTELLASEVLVPGRSTREEYASWISTLSAGEMLDVLSARQRLRIKSREELEEYKKEKAEDQRRREEYQRLMNEQIDKAREERSMYFNPRTEKMDIFDNPNKKKN